MPSTSAFPSSGRKHRAGRATRLALAIRPRAQVGEGPIGPTPSGASSDHEAPSLWDKSIVALNAEERKYEDRCHG